MVTNRETVSFLWKLASLNRLERAQNKYTITNRKYACFPVTALTGKHARRVCVCDSRDVMRMSFETSGFTCRKLILADGVFSSQLSDWKRHPFRTVFVFRLCGLDTLIKFIIIIIIIIISTSMGSFWLGIQLWQLAKQPALWLDTFWQLAL